MNLFQESTSPFAVIILATSFVLVVLFGVVALCSPVFEHPIFDAIERLFSRFAARKRLAVLTLLLCVIAIRVVALAKLEIPRPGVHDEFSYVLMGDTFAHFRLTNPTHPMWMSFETFHVNWLPTYSSIYSPAQGFLLAFGQLLGHQWIGVLLGTALMCAAILWMLQAWLPPRWALLGAVLAELKFGITSYWMNSYWGGAVAAIGGALVLGSLARLLRKATVREAILFGLGAAILANSRPYEGFLFFLPSAIYFLWWLAGRVKNSVPTRTRIKRVLLPLVAVLIVTVAFMGYYNWRTTQNPFLFPHVMNHNKYDTSGLFLWQHPTPPKKFNNEQFNEFYNDWERSEYQRSLYGIMNATAVKMVRSFVTYLWPGMILILPGVLFALRNRKLSFLVTTFFVSVGASLLVVWFNPHYAAPATCVVLALTVQSIRYLRTMRMWGRPIGLSLSRAAVLLLCLDVAANLARGQCDTFRWTCKGDVSRNMVTNYLKTLPGKHLVVVRYDSGHNVHNEWVYNGADIDGSRLLWARDLGPEQNARLISYFHDRHIWLVLPGEGGADLKPFPLEELNPPTR
jgi:hypothetical protein